MDDKKRSGSGYKRPSRLMKRRKSQRKKKQKLKEAKAAYDSAIREKRAIAKALKQEASL